jgi:hypothetical protein
MNKMMQLLPAPLRAVWGVRGHHTLNLQADINRGK